MRERRTKSGGFVVSTELMLVATILVIGLIVGLSAVRAAVVTELADLGGAIAATNQTYSYSGASGHHAGTAGSSWVDTQDDCDDGSSQADTNSRCVVICGTPATPEGPAVP